VTVSIYSMFTPETAASIYKSGFELMAALNVAVTTWREGDPTRAVLNYIAEVIENRDLVISSYIRSGFLSWAEGGWLTLHAKEIYGIERDEAEYATSTVTIQNTSGAHYTWDAGALRFSSSTSGATYRSTSGGTLAGPGYLDIDVIADEPGSSSSAGTDEIDTLLTPFLGVSMYSSTIAVGQDEQSDASLRTQCRAALGALSPNGPPDAYEYVCVTEALTGDTEITKATSDGNTSDGTVAVWVAGASGPVSSGALALAQDAVEAWATPLCVTPTVQNATSIDVNLTATVSGTGVPATIEDDVESALAAMLAEIPIGKDGEPGLLALSALYSLIQGVLVDSGVAGATATITVPSGNVTATAGQNLVVGTVSVTEV
jgi:hypothetical protein